MLCVQAHILAEGSYQELQSSDFDFAKLLESSKKTTDESDNGSSNNNESAVHVDVFLGSPQQSDSPSIDDSKINGVAETKPVEVAETSSSGNVSHEVYFSYISAGGSVIQISCLIFICILTQILGTGGDYWISYW